MNELPTERLTAAERECLQRVLNHQTAKEMARDLGISHHAVEKRLKRARIKLGTLTSLEAARKFAARYEKTVSGSSDLSQDNAHPLFDLQASRKRPLQWRTYVMLMTILLAGSLSLSWHYSEPEAESVATQWDDQLNSGNEIAQSLAGEIRRRTEDAKMTFKTLDRNQSGKIEHVEWESPIPGVSDDLLQKAMISIPIGKSSASGTINLDEGRERSRAVFDIMDRDGDGLVDREEFVSHAIEYGARVMVLRTN